MCRRAGGDGADGLDLSKAAGADRAAPGGSADADSAALARSQDDAGGTAGDVPDDCRCGAAAVPAGGDPVQSFVEWTERGAVRRCAATTGCRCDYAQDDHGSIGPATSPSCRTRTTPAR